MAISDRKKFANHLESASIEISNVSDRIAELGRLGQGIVGYEIPGILARHALGNLQGTLALLSNMKEVVLRPARKRTRKARGRR